MSTINIRTGDIVIPAQNLSSIKVKHFNKIKTWLYYSQQSEKSPVPLNVKFYAIILDKDDKYLNHCLVEKLDEDGFSFTPVGMMVNKSGSKFYCEMNQTVEINLDEVSKDVEKILLCAFLSCGAAKLVFSISESYLMLVLMIPNSILRNIVFLLLNVFLKHSQTKL